MFKNPLKDLMIFMTTKNCMELARGIAVYSTLYEMAKTPEQKTYVMEKLNLSQLQVLDAFLEAKDSFTKNLLAAEGDNSSNGTNEGGKRGY